jgi:hypothetical protein
MPPSATESTVVAGKHAGSESPVCDMCSHPIEFHDVVALRYCAASASSALSRGCVCKLPVSGLN